MLLGGIETYRHSSIDVDLGKTWLPELYMPPERCPMPDGMRQMYTVAPGPIANALEGELLEHRDFVYEEHLKLPLEF